MRDIDEVFNLRLLDDGAGGDTGDTSGDGGESVSYGVPDEPADAGQEQAAGGQAVDTNAEFDALIRKGGKYADVFNDRVSNIVQHRIGDSKQMQTQMQAMQPIMQLLQDKYGQTDLSQLQAAIEEDESFFEEAAMERGMTVDQYKQVSKLERENAAFREAQRAQDEQRGAQQQQSQWYAEEQALRQQYPDFRLQDEIQNPAFAQLLQRGNSVTDAFRLTHFDDLVSAAQQQSASIAGQRAAAAYRQNAARPTENGAAGRAGQRIVSDPSALTSEDFDRIYEQVRRGQKIRF